MRALITGAKGQLGGELLCCVPAGWEAQGVDLPELDLTDAAAVASQVSSFAPQVIIHAGAYTAVDKAEDDAVAAFAVNRDAVMHLARAVNASGARLIYVSTDYVFDGCGNRPYQPDDPTRPLGVYGKSKLAGEAVLQELLPRHNVIVRTAWLYSVRGTNFVKTMLRLMKERADLSVVADQVGTPTSATTLAMVLWMFAARPELSGVFHWTDAGVTTWYDFAMAIREEGISVGLLDATAAQVRPVTTAEYKTRALRPAYSVLDKSATYQAMGITPVHWQLPLRQVIQDIARSRDAISQ